MADAFPAALAVTLRYEGGYANDPADAGGETAYGISKAQYPLLDIKALTRDQAAAVYRRDYWDRYHCPALPYPLALILFDAVVNHAPANPVRWLQAAVRATQDGAIGARTLAAVAAYPDVVAAARDFTASRIEYVKTLPAYPRFGKGWHARHVGVLAEALR